VTDSEAQSRYASPGRRRSARDSGIDLAGREVPVLLEQRLETAEPTPEVAGQIDLAWQLFHAEAENVGIATTKRYEEVGQAEDSAFPPFVEHGLLGFPNDRCEELGSAAHVARRGHGVTIRSISGGMTASTTYESSGGDINARKHGFL